MTTSFANITPGQFELTPCRVTYKGVDLGATVGNVIVKIEQGLADLKADQLGTTVIDRKVSGMVISIETALAETQLKDNWEVVFPAYKLVEEGGNKLFFFDSQVGQSMVALAGELILHPLSRADDDLSGDVKVFLATADGKSELPFGPTEQQKLKVIWNMYPDFTTQPPRFMAFGDTSIGLIPSSADPAVPATGNTGDGTVSGIATYQDTKTETISLQCVTAAVNGGTFFISGSLSGALGLATVGIAFVSDVISFTINDGSTDFVVNDSFTIDTTAANYS